MPGSPYTDLERPPLDARRLRPALITPDGLWTRLELRVETGSTNADVVEAARSGEPEGLVVVAERQSAGRGRRDRSWESPPRAGIALSVLLRPGVADPGRGWPAAPPAGYGWLPLLAGVALVEAVSRLAELPARLKWPNDLLVPVADPDRGMPVSPRPALRSSRRPRWRSVPASWPRRCRMRLERHRPSCSVIGLNVTLRADELPVNPTGLPATSLRLAGAATTDRDPLLRAVLRQLARWYQRWRATGGDPVACWPAGGVPGALRDDRS